MHYASTKIITIERPDLSGVVMEHVPMIHETVKKWAKW